MSFISYLLLQQQKSGTKRAKTAPKGARAAAWFPSRACDASPSFPSCQIPNQPRRARTFPAGASVGREGERETERKSKIEVTLQKGTFPLFALKIKHHSRVENVQNGLNALELLKVSCLRLIPTCTLLLFIVFFYKCCVLCAFILQKEASVSGKSWFPLISFTNQLTRECVSPVRLLTAQVTFVCKIEI